MEKARERYLISRSQTSSWLSEPTPEVNIMLNATTIASIYFLLRSFLFQQAMSIGSDYKYAAKHGPSWEIRLKLSTTTMHGSYYNCRCSLL